MDKIKIIQKEDPILRQRAKEVPLDEIKSGKIQNLIKRMKEAIKENMEAVAIAAPQLGKPLRIFVISKYIFSPKNEEMKKDNLGYLVFINPKILKKSREQKILTEGCLSVKDIYGTIKRSVKIKVESYDENGKKFVKSGGGLFSQVIQHEIDHLDGILFTDTATALRKYEKTEK